MSLHEFLEENEIISVMPTATLAEIDDILATLDDEEINDFGETIYDNFFDGEADDYEFDLEDVNQMIQELGTPFYDEVLQFLEFADDDSLEEKVSRILKAKNMNKRKRSYMKLKKSELRKGKASRKRDARKNKSKTKRYYRTNKKKIAAYQSSRAKAIKSGKHKVKIRKK